MINIGEIIRQLSGNLEAVRALVQTISAEEAQWKPDSETWSLQGVMAHLYNEERIDFRKHLREMLNAPEELWSMFRSEDLIPVENLQQALEGFITEREGSIAWLKALESPDWDIKAEAPWGIISAGDVLVSWVEHDFLHMRQLIELLYAWNARQAAPYSVQYAGEW